MSEWVAHAANNKLLSGTAYVEERNQEAGYNVQAGYQRHSVYNCQSGENCPAGNGWRVGDKTQAVKRGSRVE
jgi:hypothetical protein